MKMDPTPSIPTGLRYLALFLHLLARMVHSTEILRIFESSRADGENRVVAPVITLYKVKSRLRCATRCLLDEECNGYNYYKTDGQCEMFSYSASTMLSPTPLKDGWELWLPEGCPELDRRPSFTSHTTAMLIRGQVNLVDIYCHVTGTGIKSFLNLQTINWAYGDDGGSEFARYGIDLESLTIRRDDLTFATVIEYRSAHGDVGDAATCGCCHCHGAIISAYVFNIQGTAFELAATTDNVFTGTGYHFINDLRSQYAGVEHEGCCGQALLSDEDGEISLALRT